MCFLGIKPTTFALLTQCSNHWATGTYSYMLIWPTRSHNIFYLCALFLRDRFYISYCTFRRSFKEKCPRSGAKIQVQCVNPGTFALCWYRHVLLCFYLRCFRNVLRRFRFQYLGAVAKNVCSIVLEICPTPNPKDSVEKCNIYIKMHVLMQPCCLNFLICRFCWSMITRDSNRSSSPLCSNTSLYSVSYRTNLLSMKIHRHEAGYVRSPSFLILFWNHNIIFFK